MLFADVAHGTEEKKKGGNVSIHIHHSNAQNKDIANQGEWHVLLFKRNKTVPVLW